MKDFSYWVEYEGASEGSGRSEKLWLMNPDTHQTGLFKYKKDLHTTDHISECIASDLATLIGIPCACFEIGTYRGREGSMSYNIVEDKSMILIEGVSCIGLEYDSFNSETLIDEKTKERYSLEMIKKSVRQLLPFSDILSICVFDFLIGNTDRHQSNWAVILQNKKLRLCPLYDNSSSLCAYVKESKVKQYLGKDMTLWNSLVDTKSKSLIRITSADKNQPTHLELLRFLKENYDKETKDIITVIENSVTDENVQVILNKYQEFLTKEREVLIKKYILEKVQLMKDVYKKEN